MLDMIIKNTGNSRSLRSVANFMTLYPTYEAFVQALVSGTLPVDIGGVNAAGVQQMGTPLNKANLLTDATEVSLWGGAANRTVDQALLRLHQLTVYIQGIAQGRALSTWGSYVGTGTYGQANPNTLTFPFQPKLVLIHGSRQAAGFIAAYGVPEVQLFSGVDGAYGTNSIRWSGNNMSWFQFTANPYYQLNSENQTYYYTAIG